MIPLSHFFRATILLGVALFLSAMITQYLWNEYLIECFDVQKLEYKQALALHIICFLLFGRTSMFNVINTIENVEEVIDNKGEKK
jgi:hypothetical protein